MRVPIFQIDAFASRRFTGNPAAVVLLEAWPDEAVLQAVASENNLSETAYLRRVGEHYELRWFTPRAEVALCGHATLASAFVVLEFLDPRRSSVAFETLSGRLVVEREEDRFAMDFPARFGDLVPDIPDPLIDALGIDVQELWQAGDDLMAVLARPDEVLELTPDLYEIERLDCRGLIVTALGGPDCDFVSRFFAPSVGVAEDPVTGSAHCALAPYWGERLGKARILGRQLSRRGGEVYCRLAGERVVLGGHAVPYLQGFIEI